MFTREEYENLINNSPLFEIDKESSPALYKSERYNFLTLLTDYYRLYIYPNKSLDSYGMTLMETAIECIKYYDKNKGPFLHLFNSSLKRDLRVAKGKELIEEKRQGIKVSNEDDKLIRKIIALANSKGLDIYNSTVQEKLAKVLNVDSDKLKELIRINDDSIAVSSRVTNEDGDEIELFDLQASKEKTAEEKIIEESEFALLVEKIDKVFSTHRKVLKEKLSRLLTVEIIKACNEDLSIARRVLFNKEIYSEDIFEYYSKNGKLPTRLEIGKMLGMVAQEKSIETKLSNVLADFVKKMEGKHNGQ